MNQELQATKQPNPSHYLGVHCQFCAEPIPVPARVARQITAGHDSDALGRYLSSLLNLRCRACHKEYFYDVSEASQIEGAPRRFAARSHATEHFEQPPHPQRAHAAHQ